MTTLKGNLGDIVVKCQEHTQGLAQNAKETNDRLNTLQETMTAVIDTNTKCQEHTQALAETKDKLSTLEETIGDVINTKCQGHKKKL